VRTLYVALVLPKILTNCPLILLVAESDLILGPNITKDASITFVNHWSVWISNIIERTVTL